MRTSASRLVTFSRSLGRAGWLLTAITLVAVFFRFYHLDQTPPGFQFDQAFYVFDALRLLQGQFAIFFPAPGGSEPLYPYLATVGVAVFGPDTPLGVKITSAVLGVSTIPILYLFGRAVFRSTRIGLLAALFAAISSWHIFYSRDGERLTLLVLLATLTFFFLWRALERSRRRAFILTGVCLGLSLYTYPAARILPLAVLVVIVFAARQARAAWHAYLGYGALTFAVAALLFSPLAFYYVSHPDDFIAHTAQVSIFASQTDLASALANNVWRLLGMFLFKGDDGIIRNVPGRPIFDPFSGVLFVAGVIVLFIALVAPRLSRLERRRALLIATWIGLAMALSLFSDDAPNYGRMLIALPGLMVLPAWGAVAIGERLRPLALRRLSAGMLAAILVASTFLTFRDYFITFANLPVLYESFDTDKVEIANWIKARANAQSIFLAPLYYQQATISLLTRDTRLKSFDSRDTIVLPGSAQGRDAVFAFPPEQETRVQTMAARLGSLGAREDLMGSNGARLLWLYRVPAKNLPAWQNALDALGRGGAFVQPRTTASAIWENEIELLGYTVAAAGPGGRNLTVTLFLRALKSMATSYAFSVKARDEQARVWGQEDKYPGDNSYPTSLWDPGDVIVEQFYPGLSACAPAGEYHLTVEAYDPVTGQVLASSDNGDAAIALGSMNAGASQGNRFEDLEPAQTLDLNVTPQLHLIGITRTPNELHGGDALSLSLFWTGTGSGAAPSVSIRLRDSSGKDWQLVAETISLPPAGRGLCTLFDLNTPKGLAPGAAGIFIDDVKIDSVNIVL